MDCSNCGNPLESTTDPCPTCGTVPAVVVESSEASGGRWRVGLLGFVAVVVLAGASFAMFGLVGGTEAEPDADVTVDFAPPPETTVGTAATTPTTEDAQEDQAAWKEASVEGALPPFQQPEGDAAVGLPLPTVSGFGFGGEAQTIAADGRPKVIVFLAHWCPHCQREVPAVQEYLDANGVPEGVDFISIATGIDDARPNYPPDDWLEGEGWEPPVIVDPSGAIADAYGLTAFPFYVFVRGDNTVDFRITGELDPNAVFGYAETLFGAAPARPDPGPADYAAAAAQPTACGGEAPAPPLDLSFDAPGEAPAGDVLVLVTSCGEVRVDLDASSAPETVDSMRFLAAEGFFDGTVCHRLVPGFVLQCGDPTATGIGSPGYRVPDEFPDSSEVYVAGTVAMANAGPGTTGSQFFIVIGDATFLPPQFTVIGTIDDIEPLIEALDEVPLGVSRSGELSAPLETIYIETATVEE